MDSKPTTLKALAYVQQRLEEARSALKMTFTPDDGIGELASINLVLSDYVPELGTGTGRTHARWPSHR